MVDGQFLLERREGTVERVGGVRYVELGILLIREEKREIPFERVICGIHALVGVMRLCLAV